MVKVMIGVFLTKHYSAMPSTFTSASTGSITNSLNSLQWKIILLSCCFVLYTIDNCAKTIDIGHGTYAGTWARCKARYYTTITIWNPNGDERVLILPETSPRVMSSPCLASPKVWLISKFIRSWFGRKYSCTFSLTCRRNAECFSFRIVRLTGNIKFLELQAFMTKEISLNGTRSRSCWSSEAGKLNCKRFALVVIYIWSGGFPIFKCHIETGRNFHLRQ